MSLYQENNILYNTIEMNNDELLEINRKINIPNIEGQEKNLNLFVKQGSRVNLNWRLKNIWDEWLDLGVPEEVVLPEGVSRIDNNYIYNPVEDDFNQLNFIENMFYEDDTEYIEMPSSLDNPDNPPNYMTYYGDDDEVMLYKKFFKLDGADTLDVEENVYNLTKEVLILPRGEITIQLNQKYEKEAEDGSITTGYAIKNLPSFNTENMTDEEIEAEVRAVYTGYTEGYQGGGGGGGGGAEGADTNSNSSNSGGSATSSGSTGGGCYKGKHNKITNFPDMKVCNFLSSNNNCFFACCKLELGLQDIKGFGFKGACNKIRRRYNIEDNTPITTKKAVQILEDLAISLCILNGDNKVIIGEQGDNIELILTDDHYMRIYNKKPLQVCKDCGFKFVKTHSKKNCLEMSIYNNPEDVGVRYLKLGKVDKNIKNKNDNILHYDIESYSDGYGEQTPFIVGYIFRGDYGYFTGADCMKELYNFIKTYGEDEEGKPLIQYVNAYNGGRYDHYFLWREVLASGDVFDEFLMNMGSILSAKVYGFKFIDLNRHLTGSLKTNLINTNCSVAKGEIDYDLFSTWEETSEELRKDCLIYLKADVLGLKELYEKTNDTIFNKYKRNLCDFVTLSSMAFDIWKDLYMGKNKIYIPDRKKEKFFRRAVYGGRCYKNANRFESKQYQEIKEGKVKYEDIDDYVFDADVVSLYPTAMRNNLYPVGKPIRTERYQKGKLGLYLVNFSAPKNLLYPYLPRRKKDNGLAWDLEDGGGVYTSIDIENAKSMGYTFTIKYGYYWKEGKYIFKDYLDEFFKAKKSAVKGTPAYMTAKLFLNALYGKMIQKPIHTKNSYVKSGDEYRNIITGNIITGIEQVGPKLWYVSYISRKEEELEKNVSKPTQNGAFILSYSRTIMMDYYKQVNPNNKLKEQFYYTDTDAFHVHSSLINRVKLSKDLGGLDDDVGGKIIKAFWIAPKLYAYEYIKEGTGELKYHIRGKGIKTGNKKNKNLVFNDYIAMDRGESKTLKADFNMRRVHNKLSKKDEEKGLNNFSIMTTYNDEKTINTSPWIKRNFVDNNWSVPLNYKGEYLKLSV